MTMHLGLRWRAWQIKVDRNASESSVEVQFYKDSSWLVLSFTDVDV